MKVWIIKIIFKIDWFEVFVLFEKLYFVGYNIKYLEFKDVKNKLDGFVVFGVFIEVW